MLAGAEYLGGCSKRFSGVERLLTTHHPTRPRGGGRYRGSGTEMRRFESISHGTTPSPSRIGEDRPAAVTLPGMGDRDPPRSPSDYGRVYPLVNEGGAGARDAESAASSFGPLRGPSFIANTPDCALAGFLCGFLSETNPDEAYVHMAGVAPELRRQGIGRRLYETFFEAARAHGRSRVSLITAPINTGSIAFHEALDFELDRGARELRRPGEDRLVSSSP